jgi:hypothetical protein
MLAEMKREGKPKEDLENPILKNNHKKPQKISFEW